MVRWRHGGKGQRSVKKVSVTQGGEEGEVSPKQGIRELTHDSGTDVRDQNCKRQIDGA